MERNEMMLIFVELSLALGGFTGLILALWNRENWTKINRVRLTTVVTAVFGGAVVPLIAIVLTEFGLAEMMTWKISSGTMIVWDIVWFLTIGKLALNEFLKPVQPSDASPLLGMTMILITIGHIGSQLINCFGYFDKYAFAVLFAGLVWHFIVGVIIFMRVLFTQSIQNMEN